MKVSSMLSQKLSKQGHKKDNYVVNYNDYVKF